MRNNSLLKKSLLAVTTAAFAAVLGFGFDANAAGSLDASKINVNPGTKTLTISDISGDTEIFVGYGKVNATKKLLSVANGAFDVYKPDNSTVTVDLSHLKAKDNNYIEIKGNDKTDPVVVKITASEGKFKADKVYYNKETSLPEFSFKANGTAVSGTSIQAKTDTMDWTDYTNAGAVINRLVDRGGTVYFREAASASGALSAPGDEEVSLVKNGPKYKVYDKIGGKEITMPSNEVKAKVSARANGPAINVDYVKGTVKFKNKSMYRKYATAADLTSATAKEAGSKEVVSVTGAASIVESWIPVPQDGTKNTKPSSRITSIVLPAVETLTGTIGANVNITGASVTVSGKSIVCNDDTGNNAGKNVIFNNDIKETFEFYVSENGKTPTSETKATKSVGSEKTGVKLKIKDTYAGKTVYVRKKGDKKNGIFTTEWTVFGKFGGSEAGGNGGTGSVDPVTYTVTTNKDSITSSDFDFSTKLCAVTASANNGSEPFTEIKWTFSGSGAQISGADNETTVNLEQTGQNPSGTLKVVIKTAKGQGEKSITVG